MVDVPQTRITIKDGVIEVEGIGYQGRECLQDLERLLAALRRYGVYVNIEDQREKEDEVGVEVQH